MTAPALSLRQLCFTGPGKEPAVVKFTEGLNVIYGASDTGKSFVLEAIDFMLGGQAQLRDIPERVGYDRIALSIAPSNGGEFTLFRATSGGQFQLADGVHQTPPPGVDLQVLASKHAADNPDTVSAFLLRHIGLENRRVRVNKKNDTNSLSFRNLVHLCLVGEGDIQKQSSPIEGGQATQRTRELAVFKLLLTGVDDSAVVASTADAAATQSVSAKLDFVDELLESYRSRLEDDAVTNDELRDQVTHLENSLERSQAGLQSTEAQYRQLLERRSALRTRVEGGSERRTEIGELLARFALLDDHYRSDLNRLEGIREAGSLVVALSPTVCPLCGADTEHQQLGADCDGNVDQVVAAATAESAKIEKLRTELAQTVSQLRGEAQSFDRLLPRLRNELAGVENEIQQQSPDLLQMRASYTELVEKRSKVRAELALREQIADLESRREALENPSEGESAPTNGTTELPSVTLDRFSRKVEAILKAWHFPEAERVYFEEATRDLVIGGKRRGSRGKGMRAITHAAFTIGLLEYCREISQPHPGFVVLDSPLLAYREPEGTDDDLRGTDVQEQFYNYLAQWTNWQAIIVENVDPPQPIKNLDTALIFTKNNHRGRYGLFPYVD